MAKRVVKPSGVSNGLVALAIKMEQPAHIPAGFRRFVGVGLSISHGQMTYTASPDGWVDLPSGEDWYRPMIDAGILKEHFGEPQTELV